MKEKLNSQKKVFYICNGVAFAILAALLVVASFFDLELSKAIGNQNSFYGQFFAIVGEYPSYFILPIAATIFFFNADNFEKKRTRIAVRSVGAVLVFFGWFIFAFAGEKIVKVPNIAGFSVFAGVFYGAISLAVGRLVPKETMTRLLKFAVFAVAFLVVALVVIQVSKHIWSRMRFRDMLKEGSYDGFTPWYKTVFGRENPNPDYKYTSFPSGHSSSIVHIFLLCVLCDILPTWKAKKWLKPTLWISCTIFCVVGCFSRIVNCAHFLSDIVVGGGVTYLIFLGMRYLFFRNEKYTFAFSDRKMEKFKANSIKLVESES